MRSNAPMLASLAAAAILASTGCGGEAVPEAPAESSRDPLPVSSPSPEARALMDRALALYRQGDFQGALVEAVTAIEVSPASAETYRLASRIFTDAGMDRQAVSFFDQVSGELPDRPEPWFYKGFHEFHLNMWNEALESFRRSSELDPSHAESHLRQGLIHQYLGDFEASLRSLRTAHELKPSSAEVAAQLVDALRIAGKYDEVEEVLTRVIAAVPDSAKLHHELGRLRLRQGREDEAEAVLRRAIELDRMIPGPHRDLANVLLRSGREQEARGEQATADRLTDYYRRKHHLMARLGVSPDRFELPLLLGELELTEGRYAQALQWLSRARSLGAPSERVAAARVECLVGLDRPDSAEAELPRLGHGPDGRADLARARLLAKRGEIDRALVRLEEALTRGPEERDFLRRAGDLYASVGRSDESMRLLEKAAGIPRVGTP